MAERKEREDEKALKMVLESYVPLDIIREILYELPCKSLVRLMSTCKLWHSLATNRDFISSYQRRTVSNPSHFCLLDLVDKRIHLYSLDADSFNHVRSFAPSPLDCSYKAMLPSSYGLTCGLYSHDHGAKMKMIIFNPTTQQIMIEIGMPPYGPRNGSWVLGLGFGFHPQTNEYKVIVFSQSTDKDDIISGHVLTLQPGRSIWRPISRSISSAQGSAGRNIMALSVEGVLYWGYLPRSQSKFDILSFDLQSEEFQWVPSAGIPECPGPIGCSLLFSKLENLQEKLCLVEAFGDHDHRREHQINWTVNIWMLKDATRGDWMPLHRLDFRLAYSPDCTGFYMVSLCIRHGKVILRHGPKIYSYDIEEKSLRVLKGEYLNDGQRFGVVYAHAETLVSIS